MNIFTFTCISLMLLEDCNSFVTPPGVLSLPTRFQERRGWASAISAGQTTGSHFGDPCDDDEQCDSGMCCTSCSSEEGSCVCPCSDRGELGSQNGPWNGQFPVGKCCCGTLLRGDQGVQSSKFLSKVRKATCNDHQSIFTSLEDYKMKPFSATSPFKMLKQFADPCDTYADCDSGICATGCDCDNTLLDIPQSCSCNCPQRYPNKSCGAFVVGANPKLQYCPPCSVETCSNTSLVDCRYACTSGIQAGKCSNYPAYFLGTLHCDSCCNLNMCLVNLTTEYLTIAFNGNSELRSLALREPISLNKPVSEEMKTKMSLDEFIDKSITNWMGSDHRRGDRWQQLRGVDTKGEDFWTAD